MERSESNQLEAAPILCRTGCGFFGSSNTDGLCSKCYKDHLKKKQQPPPTTSAAASSSASSTPSSSSSTTSSTNNIIMSSAAAATTAADTVSVSAASLPSLHPAATVTAQPTVPSISSSQAVTGACEVVPSISASPVAGACAAQAAAVPIASPSLSDLPASTSSSPLDADQDSSSSSSDKDASKKKKNKCLSCKKKVGLTGFTCRCGGLFCAVHRYSNEHGCKFDYRELGAEEIRRNNPVIKGEKIQKI